MNLNNNLSNKTLILLLILLVLIIYIILYKREYLLSDTDITNLMYKRFDEMVRGINVTVANSSGKTILGVKKHNIDFEIPNIIFNINTNYIFVYSDIPNKKILVFNFDKFIRIYDFNTNQLITYTVSLINKPRIISSRFRIINNGDEYSININFNESENVVSVGPQINFNKQDLLNLNNFMNILNNNSNNFMVNMDPFDPYKFVDNIVDENRIVVTGGGEQQSTVTPGQTTVPAGQTTVPAGQTTVTPGMRKNRIFDCLPEDTFKKIQSNFDDLINSSKSVNYDNKFDNIIKLVLNFDNYNIIKNQIEIFKTLSDDQIVCLLERNDPNFCNDFNNSISRDEIKQIEYNLKSIRQILNLYQNQILDVKKIILTRLLLVINKCTNLTKENKIKILNIFKNILYTAEYISYFLGNNWDLIKKIDDTIKNVN